MWKKTTRFQVRGQHGTFVDSCDTIQYAKRYLIPRSKRVIWEWNETANRYEVWAEEEKRVPVVYPRHPQVL